MQFEICPCCGKPKKPKTTTGRWPPNFCLVHVPPHLCATCNGDGCDECNDTGLVGGCRRVGTKRVKTHWSGKGKSTGNHDLMVDWAPKPEGYEVLKHWDANGYEETEAWDCVEECAARRIGEQSGVSSERLRILHHKSASGFVDDGAGYETVTHGGMGTAARFFPQFGWAAEVAERLAAADQVRYCAKASRKERDAGLEAIPEQEVAYSKYRENYKDTKDFVTHYPNGKPRPVNKLRNPHPTVKNIALCRWLATLLLPPPEYAPRRILVPFAGVASEMIAASLASWEFVHGIEMSEEYCAIGEARLSWWLRQLRLPGMEGL